ncbi:MAG: prolyl oligopeptidase family serine peptidase, partial [Mobilicoccus sp.]|nr:prolyl oligopeptidase family serine peptidase [Mobilicoccus sp.]
MPRRVGSLARRGAWGVAYVLTFLVVFVMSAVVGLGGMSNDVFTLQGSGDTAEILEVTDRHVIEVPYLDKTGTRVTRPVVLYVPQNATGPVPLVFVAHYEIDAGSADLGDYLRQGWAVASPTEVTQAENGRLTDDNLVFNNAALHAMRQRVEVDRERVAIVGGSAGGYMALMLSHLQLGAVATVADAPITNAYFNLRQYFPLVEHLNRCRFSAE